MSMAFAVELKRLTAVVKALEANLVELRGRAHVMGARIAALEQHSGVVTNGVKAETQIEQPEYRPQPESEPPAGADDGRGSGVRDRLQRRAGNGR